MAFTTLEIEESIRIAAAPEIVWRFLADPNSWVHWWPGCRAAQTRDRKSLHDGSEVTFDLHLGWLRLKVAARVEAATAPRTLLWVGRGGGLTGRHAFFLDAKPDGTLVRQRETFTGPGVLLYRLLRLDKATRQMFRSNLKGLKRIVERAA